MKKAISLIIILIFFVGCYDAIYAPDTNEDNFYNINYENSEKQHSLLTPPLRIGFNDFHRAIPIPEVTIAHAAVYNTDAEGDYIAEYTQPDMTDTLDGYITANLDFFTEVLRSSLDIYVDSLKNLQKYQAVNALTLFIHESFQDFFGLSYYRWGGDITDRDQPQTEGHTRSTKRFGMDCSGFGASPYEAAVLLGILDSTNSESAFSCFGFQYICKTDPAISDGGGRNGSTNNYRLEVSDMPKVGTLITTITSGSTPTDAQMDLMQAGDVVIKTGHMGILVEINNDLYFLEAGGSTLNEDGLYTPYLAKEALADFAQSKITDIRRCLPKMETTSGIVH